MRYARLMRGMRLSSLVKKTAILCHRWMGVTFCLLFAWWFLSGIFMMYWDFPEVSRADRLDKAQGIDAAKIRLSAEEVWTKLGGTGEPGGVTLAMLDGRPVYRFASGSFVYADTGKQQEEYPDAMLLRMASAWTSQPAESAKREDIQQPDQWTIGVRESLPLIEYSFPDGQQVYVSLATGEILQYTTTASRIGAYLGPIPHWLYFAPLRVHEELWSEPHHLCVGYWNHHGSARPDGRGLDVLAIATVSIRGSRYRRAVRRAETPSHDSGIVFRHRHLHLGVQRDALHGPSLLE